MDGIGAPCSTVASTGGGRGLDRTAPGSAGAATPRRSAFYTRRMQREVVITGIGAVSAAGIGADAMWRTLDAGETAIGPVSLFDASGFPTRLAGEIADLRARDFVPRSYRKATKVMARDTEIAVVAAQLAIADAGLASRGSGETGEAATPADATPITPDRTGCQIGAGLLSAEINELTAALTTSTTDGVFDARKWGSGEGGEAAMNNLPPLWMLKYLPNMLACHVTIIHGTEGPSNTITCAESSGILSMGEAARVIERNDADACFAGGCESKLNPLGMARLTFAKRIAPTGDETDARAFARPYDPSSGGGLPGEGGAILMLEAGETARARDPEGIYAVLAGFGAGHSGAPIFPGVFDAEPGADLVDTGLRRAIRAALDDAGITPDEVDAIVPGALGVPTADTGERNALREVFGERLGSIETITVSPALGVSAAGHGALLVAAGAMAIRRQRLPARIHTGRAPEMLVGARAGGDASLHTVLVCTPSLGGQVGAVVLRSAGSSA